MLDLGVGQALEKPVREVAVKAAKAFESAGAVVTEIDGILTRAMLDGLDDFWRRADVGRPVEADAGRARQDPALYRQWAERGARLSGVDVIRGFNMTMAIRAAAAKLFCELDYVISPVSPVVNFAAELASPINDPEKALRAHRLHRALEHVENPALSINGGYDGNGFPIGVQIIGRRFTSPIGVLADGRRRRRPRVPDERSGRSLDSIVCRATSIRPQARHSLMWSCHPCFLSSRIPAPRFAPSQVGGSPTAVAARSLAETGPKATVRLA